MRCKYCNVELYGDSDICPLCHQKVTDAKGEYKERYYPPKAKRRPRLPMQVINRVYLLVAILSFIICVTVNYLTNKSVLWCYIVGITLAYGYILLRHTIQSNSGVGSKVFVQGLSIFIVLQVVRLVSDEVGREISLDYGLPIIIALSVLAQGVVLVVLGGRDKSLFLSTMTLSVLGYLPIILYGCGVIQILIPSVVTAVLCSILLFATVIFGRKAILSEAKKLFHS